MTSTTEGTTTSASPTSVSSTSRVARPDVIELFPPASEEERTQRDHNRCQGFISHLYQNDPLIGCLLTAIKRSKCAFPQEKIQCVPCPTYASGQFSPEQGITLCQNFIVEESHAKETLAHELVHAYDYCKYQFDALNIQHVACTEIRAANLSGDCRWMNEWMRGHFAFRHQHLACVRRRAILSLQNLPVSQGHDIEAVVDKVLPACIADTSPFLDIPY